MPSTSALLTQERSSVDLWMNMVKDFLILKVYSHLSKDAHKLGNFRELDQIG